MTVNLDCKVSRLTRTRFLLRPGATRTPRPDPSHLPGPRIKLRRVPVCTSDVNRIGESRCGMTVPQAINLVSRRLWCFNGVVVLCHRMCRSKPHCSVGTPFALYVHLPRRSSHQ